MIPVSAGTKFPRNLNFFACLFCAALFSDSSGKRERKSRAFYRGKYLAGAFFLRGGGGENPRVFSAAVLDGLGFNFAGCAGLPRGMVK